VVTTRRFGNDPDPHRCLRIGYLSGDFRKHSVAFSFEPLLDGHDRERFQCFGYGHSEHQDETTVRLKNKFDRYHDVTGHAPEAIADRIVQDRIDVLISLVSHCHVRSMKTLALRPAPVQIDIGSASSTGLSSVDYRITDALLDPPASQPYYTETLIHIPNGYQPYCPPRDSAPVGPLPALQNGQITFGSFNSHKKITPQVVACWSSILRQIPKSRLLLKSAGFIDQEVRTRLIDNFTQEGIAPRRLCFAYRLPMASHLNLYNEIDIALDTFPYNGAITTLEALWMGVPTVTLAGDTLIGRSGLAILTHVGLSRLVGRDEHHMAAIAVGLAQNLPVLTRLRAGLRDALQASPLCHVTQIAADVEAAYRQVWQRWCLSQTTGEGRWE
jgi:predicted O-linked N-acetylglucosamine transferase (SPINDLY family)